MFAVTREVADHESNASLRQTALFKNVYKYTCSIIMLVVLRLSTAPEFNVSAWLVVKMRHNVSLLLASGCVTCQHMSTAVDNMRLLFACECYYSNMSYHRDDHNIKVSNNGHFKTVHLGCIWQKPAIHRIVLLTLTICIDICRNWCLLE